MRGHCFAKISLLDKLRLSHVLNLMECLYVPDHSRNLLSVSALGQKGATAVFDDACELRCSDSLFLLSKGMVCTWLKIFQFVLQTLEALLKLILIFGIADWVAIISANFKSYQTRLKEWNCTTQASLTVLTFVLKRNWFENLLVLRLLCESLESWMGLFQRQRSNGTYFFGWASVSWVFLTATVASFVVFSWNRCRKFWKTSASFVLMRVLLRHSRLDVEVWWRRRVWYKSFCWVLFCARN